MRSHSRKGRCSPYGKPQKLVIWNLLIEIQLLLLCS